MDRGEAGGVEVKFQPGPYGWAIWMMKGSKMPVNEMPMGNSLCMEGAAKPQTFREKLESQNERLRRDLDHGEKFAAHYDSLSDDQKATFEGLLGRVYLH
jgi:hypothetical protein